jgi:hypothetical protein
VSTSFHTVHLKLLHEVSESDVGQEPELAALHTLQRHGLHVAPTLIVPGRAEEWFYELNNLPAQLSVLFAGVDLQNPDEDDIEELAPQAEALLTQHYLLDEFIDLFYARTATLPPQLRLRRPSGGAGRTVMRGRPALLALKQLWADEWRFDVLMQRLEQEHTIALHARPVLVQPGGLGPAEASLNAQASDILNRGVSLWLEPRFGITRITTGELP